MTDKLSAAEQEAADARKARGDAVAAQADSANEAAEAKAAAVNL